MNTFKRNKIQLLNEAVFEAKRFTKRVNEWKKILQDDEFGIHASKEGGAAKRASMDLTRVLTKIRR